MPSKAKKARTAPIVSPKTQSVHSQKVKGRDFWKTTSEARLMSNKSAEKRTHFTNVHFWQNRVRGVGAGEASFSGDRETFLSPCKRVFNPGLGPGCARVRGRDSSGSPGTGVPFNSARSPFPKTSFLTDQGWNGMRFWAIQNGAGRWTNLQYPRTAALCAAAREMAVGRLSRRRASQLVRVAAWRDCLEIETRSSSALNMLPSRKTCFKIPSNPGRLRACCIKF